MQKIFLRFAKSLGFIIIEDASETNKGKNNERINEAGFFEEGRIVYIGIFYFSRPDVLGKGKASCTSEYCANFD